MKEIYKTPKGKEYIRGQCRNIYENWPYEHTRKTVSSQRFGTTHIIEMGDESNPTLLMLHGTSSNSASWLGYIPDLMDDFHLILPDIPGQPGLSSSLRPGLGNGEIRSWLEELITEMGLEKFSILGMSLGSWIGSEFTFFHTEKVEKLCMITSGGFANVRASFLFKVLPLALMGKAGAKRLNKLISGDVTIDEAAEAFGFAVSKHMRPLTEPLPLFSDEQLQNLPIPVLYIGGKQDPMLNTEATHERLNTSVREYTGIVLEGVHHLIMDQGKTVRDFLMQEA